MFNVNKEENGTKINLVLEGRLDTTTAPELDNVIKTSLDGKTELVMDLEKLEYISSAGLRVLLSAQKTMNKQGSMVITNPTDEVKEIYEVTGFSEILTIQ